MFEIFHNFQKSFSDLISFNVMYDVPSLPWYLTFSADQLSMIMTFIQLLINFLFLYIAETIDLLQAATNILQLLVRESKTFDAK